MTVRAHDTVEFGELVVPAFDEAALYSTDPEEVSRMATQAVAHMLRVFAWPRSRVRTHDRMVA